MKQLSALGARRHAFFRSPRRMRPLGGRLDESEMLGSTPYTYYGGKKAPPHPIGGGRSRGGRFPFLSSVDFFLSFVPKTYLNPNQTRITILESFTWASLPDADPH